MNAFHCRERQSPPLKRSPGHVCLSLPGAWFLSSYNWLGEGPEGVQTRIWFTEWTEVPQFLNCGLARRKELSGVLHIRSGEFKTLVCMNLWSSVFLQSQCKIQTTFMLVIIMTRPWVKIKSTFGSISMMIWTHCYFGIIVVNRHVARSCYFVHIEKVYIIVKYFQ